MKVRLFEIKRSELAIQFSTTSAKGRDGRTVWLPISQIEHITRRPDPSGGEWKECEVTIPDWLGAKNDL